MLVGDLMQPLARCLISPLASVAEAYTPMLYHEQASLVLDEQPVRRIVRLRRVLEHLAAEALQHLAPDPLRAVATLAEEAGRIPADAPTEQVAKLLWRRPSRSLLVTDSVGNAIGLIGWAEIAGILDSLLDVDGAVRIEVPMRDGLVGLGSALQALAAAGVRVRSVHLAGMQGIHPQAVVYVEEEAARTAQEAILHLGAIPL